MTVQFAGSRSTDERRRRRLAVTGDGPATDSADPGEERPLPDCVAAELCAASPWIPRSLWKLWTLAGLLMAGLVAVAAMVYRTPAFRPELAPALDPLFQGEQPRLVVYLEVIFWTLSGQLALLVGWHRARSRLDFRGLYRVWPWAAGLMFFCGLCAATNLHTGLGVAIHQLGLFEQNTPRLSWLVPAVCLMLPVWIFLDRDIRRSTASVMLMRTALLCLIGGASVDLYGRQWLDAGSLSLIETLCGLIGSALLMISLWVQGWCVAYVTPDPPAAAAAPKAPGTGWKLFGIFGWMWSLIAGLFRRSAPAAAAPRRRKKAEETGTTAKRKRKTKRAAKPRTRKVVEEDEEEEAAESDEYEDEESAESGEEESYEEDEEEESPPARVTAPVAAKSNGPFSNSRPPDNRSAPPPAAKPPANTWQESSNDQDDEDEEGDEDGENWRADGPPAEQLKGLSKRQKRALQKQWRDQQRAQRGR